MKRVYLDYAATTPVDPEVLAEMLPYFTDTFGNANSMHSFGQAAGAAVDAARRKIAALLGVKPPRYTLRRAAPRATTGRSKGAPRRTPTAAGTSS